MKFLILLVIMLSLTAHASAFDCADVRILPLYSQGKTLFEGLITTSSPSAGTGRRQRIAGFLSDSAASTAFELSVGEEMLLVQTDEAGAFNATWTRLITSGTCELRVPGTKDVFCRRTFDFPASPTHLIISDIDDTILVSKVAHPFRLVLRTLFKSVEGREAVPGTPELYRDLAKARSTILSVAPSKSVPSDFHVGGSGPLAPGWRTSGGPMEQPLVFYLSASPSTLARFLEAFLKKERFPAGTLCLKRSLTAEGLDAQAHKKKWLKTLTTLYPGLPVILLGDSGEKDPEIYSEFLESNPVPCAGVIIRKVPDATSPLLRYNEITIKLRKLGIDFHLWSNIAELRTSLCKAGLLESGKK